LISRGPTPPPSLLSCAQNLHCHVPVKETQTV
jgi:hypothetical protein